jgi:hypothetical protein
MAIATAAAHELSIEINPVKVLRFLQSDAARPDKTAPGTGDGLDAFASEQPSSRETASHPAKGSRALTAALFLLVLIEAVPATLWVMSQVSGTPAQAMATASAPEVVPPPLIAAPPCEPTPPAAAPATAASTTAPGAAAATAARPLVAGLIAVSSPVPMHVYERGRLLGTTEAPTLMLAAGAHELEFVNEAVGYRVRRTVTVQSGATVPLRLDPPQGTLHVNAVPWAEVLIDNERVGETPIGNLKTRIGNRQVTFRHPEFGERRASVLVTLIGAARISMDMRSK